MQKSQPTDQRATTMMILRRVVLTVLQESNPFMIKILRKVVLTVLHEAKSLITETLTVEQTQLPGRRATIMRILTKVVLTVLQEVNNFMTKM